MEKKGNAKKAFDLGFNLFGDFENEPGYAGKDSREYLESLLESPGVDQRQKIKIASLLLPYQYSRQETFGKKSRLLEETKKETSIKSSKGVKE